MKHPKTYIKNANKNVAVDRSIQLQTVMSGNLSKIKNIKVEDITEIGTVIDAFVAVKDLPVGKIQTKKSDGTDVMPIYIKATAEAMDSMFGLVESYYEDAPLEADRKLVNAFALAKQYISTGTRATGILGSVTKGGHAAMGAKIVIETTVKETVSDILGEYTIAHVQSGTYNVTCTLLTGEVETEVVHIVNGVMEEVDFIFP